MLLAKIFYILLASILVIFLTDATDIFLLRFISLSSSGLVLILSSILITQFDNSVYSIGSDVLNFEFWFCLDGISLFPIFLSSLLIFLCILFIWNDHLFKEYVLNLLLIELFLLIIFVLLNF